MEGLIVIYKGRKLLCCALSAVMLAAAVSMTGCEKKKENNKTLVVGVLDDVAKMGYKNSATDSYSGYEVELGKKLGNELGYSKVEFVTAEGENRWTSLDSKSIDLLIASSAITEQRKQTYDCSPAYFTDTEFMMVENSTCYYNVNDLKGKNIAVRKGTLTALYLAQYMVKNGYMDAFDEESFDPKTFDGGIKFTVCDTYQDAAKLMETGVCDGFCDNKTVLNDCSDSDRTILFDVIATQDYGIYSPKGSDISDDVSKLITQWIDDGTLDNLKAEYNL